MPVTVASDPSHIQVWSDASAAVRVGGNSTVYANLYALRGGINIDQAVFFEGTVAGHTVYVDEAFLGAG